MTEEIYRDIKGYDKYQVSNFGNVKTKKTGRILKPSLDKDGGYCRVNLYNENKKRFNFRVHRLVGITFLENPENKYSIDHIDIDGKSNNNVNNLRFATSTEQKRNTKKKANCSSIYKGVCFHKPRNKWQSSITINKKQIHLGSFENENDAAQKYNDYIIENNMTEYFILNNII